MSDTLACHRAGLWGVLGAIGLTAALFITGAQAQTMSLPGKVDVGPAGGAQYVIPIAVPPGTAKVVPSLSISYSSQSGNGMVGYGWSLDGLPAITRCPQTIFMDGAHARVSYGSSDKFCLDGQRLVAISGSYGGDGTEYRTDVDSYSRIRSHGTSGNGPAFFEVRTKTGQILMFGTTVDSRPMTTGMLAARAWMLKQAFDTKGNFYTVTYTNDTTNGQAYPTRIDYTGNTAAGLAPYNSVRFLYDTSRLDLIPVYHAGFHQKTTVRLTNVQTYVGENLVSDYRLTYSASNGLTPTRLSSVTVCSATNVCLPATSFGTTAGGNGTFIWSYQNQGVPSTFSPPAGRNVVFEGDFNADGKADIAMVGSTHVHIGTSLGNGTFSWATYSGPDFGLQPDEQGYRLSVGDFNGDGRTDFALININTLGASVALANSGGGFTWSSSTVPGGSTNNWAGTHVLSGDFNGDGRADIGFISYYELHTGLSNGDGTFTWVGQANPYSWNLTAQNPLIAMGDFDGDGRSDFALLVGGDVHQMRSNGDGTFTYLTHGSPYGAFNTSAVSMANGDFNGDGKVDFALISNTAIYVALSKGDGTWAWSAHGSSGWNFGTPITNNWALMSGDINGDGRTDLVVVGGAYFYTFMSKGDGMFAEAVLTNSNGANFTHPPTSAYTLVSGDFTGNGLADFAFVGSNQLYTAMSDGAPAGLLQTVTSGLGLTTTVTYRPLTDASVYTKDTNAVYPVMDLIGPAHVVSRIDEPNGIGGTASTTYAYAGAKGDGRGHSLGFRQTSVTDLQTNIVQTSTQRQDFPYVGLTTTAVKKLGALTLNQVTNTFHIDNAIGTASVGNPPITTAPYRVSLVQTVTSGADLNGTAMPTVTTGYQYDLYGNATQVTVSTPDGHSKTTTNTYTNDTVNWLLARLNAATVVSDQQGGPPTPPPPGPDLKVTLSHTGSFTRGQTGVYTISISNIGSGPSSGAVSVTDTLPAGLTAAAMSGTGWTCTLATVSCTRSDLLAAGASYPAISLTVSVASNAPNSVVNSATVSGGADSVGGNNTANDPTTIVAAPGSQSFTTAGTHTFTVPSFATSLTISLYGAGGGGGGIHNVNNYQNSSGSAGSATIIASLNLTAGGGFGGTGGYYYIFDPYGPAHYPPGGGGTASGGGTNTSGNAGSGISGGAAACSGPGNGGSGGYDNPANGGGGGGGSCLSKTYLSGQIAPGAVITIVVGQGGAGGAANRPGAAGGHGRATMSWN